MPLDLPLDLIFLAMEAAGVSLTGILLAALASETGREYARRWAAGWALLAVSLVSLLAAQASGSGARILLAVHLVGGYAFAMLSARGFAVYRGDALGRRQDLVLAPVLAAWTAGLVVLGEDVGSILRSHGLALGILLLAAFADSRRTRSPGGHRTGRWVSLMALLALSMSFAGLGLLEWSGAWGASVVRVLLPFKALVDLTLLTALGFGQALLVMETVSADLARSNAELAAARDRLHVQARVDPLTSALNRHAFHSLLGGRDEDLAQRGGCVVIIDIDRLKEVNDTRGHAAGDEMIRAAAAMIRRVVRADDLLFRWGGDEFLAILFGLGETGVDARLRGLQEHRVETPEAPSLSWGIAPFESLLRIGDAIEAADRAMYDGRARRKHATGSRS